MCCCTAASVEDAARGGILNVASLASTSGLEEANRLCSVRDEKLPEVDMGCVCSLSTRNSAVNMPSLLADNSECKRLKHSRARSKR